jgi:hypothetical protein
MNAWTDLRHGIVVPALAAARVDPVTVLRED